MQQRIAPHQATVAVLLKLTEVKLLVEMVRQYGKPARHHLPYYWVQDYAERPVQDQALHEAAREPNAYSIPIDVRHAAKCRFVAGWRYKRHLVQRRF